MSALVWLKKSKMTGMRAVCKDDRRRWGREQSNVQGGKGKGDAGCPL